MPDIHHSVLCIYEIAFLYMHIYTCTLTCVYMFFCYTRNKNAIEDIWATDKTAL